MINPADIDGGRLATSVWGTKPDGSDDVMVYAGTARWDGKCMSMLGSSGELLVRLEDQWLTRLRRVEPSLKKTLLEADFSFSVTIGPLPEGADMDKYTMLGIQWPSDDAS